MEQPNNPRPNYDYTGTVQWFRDNRGYGFIECPSFKNAIFAHYSRIMTDEQFKTLSKGEVVTFQVVVTTKGLMAINIRENKVFKATAVISESTQ